MDWDKDKFSTRTIGHYRKEKGKEEVLILNGLLKRKMLPSMKLNKITFLENTVNNQTRSANLLVANPKCNVMTSAWYCT